jgi:hypothetical protein
MIEPPRQVLELVNRFERNSESYKSTHYNETQLRREFLDPFFKALGWDIDNEQGYAEAYKDVIHEDAIKVGEATKAPDYCFRIGGARKFFLEAKKPSIDIKNDVAPAFQLRRYAWTTKLPIGILSDFEEFAVYDCRVKPDHRDKASVARILYIPYSEYAQRWEEIAGIFSRDAVLKGSFDKYADSNKVKRGTADVDEEFLKTIETWRSDLARNLAIRNPKLTQRELNFAVQRIIDRIIFLRICEGRGIETYGPVEVVRAPWKLMLLVLDSWQQANPTENMEMAHVIKMCSHSFADLFNGVPPIVFRPSRMATVFIPGSARCSRRRTRVTTPACSISSRRRIVTKRPMNSRSRFRSMTNSCEKYSRAFITQSHLFLSTARRNPRSGI